MCYIWKMIAGKRISRGLYLNEAVEEGKLGEHKNEVMTDHMKLSYVEIKTKECVD